MRATTTWLGISVDAWQIIGAVAAIIAILVGVWAAFYSRRRPTRRRLEYWLAGDVALVRKASNLTITVQVNGEAVNDPHTVVVALLNNSSEDIGTNDFDAQQPLVLDVGAEIKSILRDGGGIAEIVGRSQIAIPPVRLKAGEKHFIEMLCDGQPELTLTRESMLNIDVVLYDLLDTQRRSAARAFRLGAALGLVWVTAWIAWLTFANNKFQTWVIVLFAIAAGILGGVFGVGVGYVAPFDLRRVSAALRQRRLHPPA